MEKDENLCEQHEEKDICCGDHAHEGDDALMAEMMAAREMSVEDKLKESEDKYLRMYAEFENTRKRLDKEKQSAIDFAVERFSKDMLTIADTLEMAMGHFGEGETNQVQEGIKLTFDNLMKIFERHGIKPVSHENGFDPNFHEAVMQSANADMPNDAIVAVLQKGYMLRDRVLRPSIVNVNKI